MNGPGGTGPALRVLTRGAASMAGAGAVLAGVAGTVDWPFVGTAFAAIGGALAGALAGIVTGLLLVVTRRRALSVWGARAIAGAVSAVAAVMVVIEASTSDPPPEVPQPVEVVLVVLTVVVGAALGPAIAYGWPGVADVSRLVRLVLGWGLAIGAVVGGLAGGVIGLVSYPPTAPFAVVEGGVFGSVNGLVLALLVAGVTVTLRARAAT